MIELVDVGAALLSWCSGLMHGGTAVWGLLR